MVSRYCGVFSSTTPSRCLILDGLLTRVILRLYLSSEPLLIPFKGIEQRYHHVVRWAAHGTNPLILLLGFVNLLPNALDSISVKINVPTTEECYVMSVQDDNSPVSIFSYTGSNAQDARLAAARNGAKRLRIVRFLRHGLRLCSEFVFVHLGVHFLVGSYLSIIWRVQ